MRSESGLLVLVLAVLAPFQANGAEAPSPAEVQAAMERATEFMFNEAGNRGGFVWVYTTSLEPHGELKARESMVWVEPPNTPTVGLMLLDAHVVTGEDRY